MTTTTTTTSFQLGSVRMARGKSCLSVHAIIPSVLAGNDQIATKLAHDGPQVSLHPGCAQGQGQRSRDTGTFVLSRKSQALRKFAIRVDSVPSWKLGLARTRLRVVYGDTSHVEASVVQIAVLFYAQRSVSVGPAAKRPCVDRSFSVPPTSSSVLAMLEKHVWRCCCSHT